MSLPNSTILPCKIFRETGTQLKEGANGLKIYRPNFRRIVEDKQDKIRSYTLGEKNPMKAMKYIMMVGMTGQARASRSTTSLTTSSG